MITRIMYSCREFGIESDNCAAFDSQICSCDIVMYMFMDALLHWLDLVRRLLLGGWEWGTDKGKPD